MCLPLGEHLFDYSYSVPSYHNYCYQIAVIKYALAQQYTADLYYWLYYMCLPLGELVFASYVIYMVLLVVLYTVHMTLLQVRACLAASTSVHSRTRNGHTTCVLAGGEHVQKDTGKKKSVFKIRARLTASTA
jgi:hypothetical protein